MNYEYELKKDRIYEYVIIDTKIVDSDYWSLYTLIQTVYPYDKDDDASSFQRCKRWLTQNYPEILL